VWHRIITVSECSFISAEKFWLDFFKRDMHVDQIFSKWNLFSKGTSQRDPDPAGLIMYLDWPGPLC